MEGRIDQLMRSKLRFLSTLTDLSVRYKTIKIIMLLLYDNGDLTMQTHSHPKDNLHQLWFFSQGA